MGEQVIKPVRDKNLKGSRVISPGDSYGGRAGGDSHPLTTLGS